MNVTTHKWLVACLAAGAFGTLVLPSCSDIDEADRRVVVNYVERDTIAPANPTDEPGPVDETDYFTPYSRHILVEDFTGQECKNCPTATSLIASLQDMYGHENIVAVGIHSGPLGVKPDTDPEGLATALGDTYYNYWHIEMQPYGVIDRSDGILDTDWWTAKVGWDLASEQWPATQLNIWATAVKAADSNKADISVKLAGMQGTTKGKLQVWIAEDAITAFQVMPDGTKKTDYVHNHVLRDAVNGTWGEDCSVAEGALQEFTYSYELPTQWNAANLKVVAFVYDDNGVIQAESVALTVQ